MNATARNLMMLTMATAAFLVCPAAMGSMIDCYNFNPFPENLDYTATTVEQDELVKKAKKLGYVHDAVEGLAAAEQLVSDESTPDELRRWASWQKFTLLLRSGAGVREALEWGLHCSEKYAEHADVINLRYAMVKAATLYRAKPDLTYEEVMRAARPLLTKHPAVKPLAIEGRCELAMELQDVMGRAASEEAIVRDEMMTQLRAVQQACRDLIAKPGLAGRLDNWRVYTQEHGLEPLLQAHDMESIWDREGALEGFAHAKLNTDIENQLYRVSGELSRDLKFYMEVMSDDDLRYYLTEDLQMPDDEAERLINSRQKAVSNLR
jgi:hypothetical protein